MVNAGGTKLDPDDTKADSTLKDTHRTIRRYLTIRKKHVYKETIKRIINT